MELTQLNSLNFSSVAQSSIEQVQTKKSVEIASDNKPLKVDNPIELSSTAKSSFANNLMNNIKQISTGMNIQSAISKQLEITNKIEQSITSVISNSKKNLNDIQPEIKNLMDGFNNYSSKISTSISAISGNSTDNEKSRIYFDGILGAKPLSSEEILAEVESQRERLQNINKAANDEVLNNIQKSHNMFSAQKQELIDKEPQVQKFDFNIESNNFDAKTLQNIQGSITDTQANAQVDQSVKLLAS